MNLCSPMYGRKKGKKKLAVLSLVWIDKDLPKMLIFWEAIGKMFQKKMNYNNLLRKLDIAWGYWWDQSQLKQTYRGVFSSVGTARPWGRVVILISWGNHSSWCSLGRGIGYVYISWPVFTDRFLNRILFLGKTMFLISSKATVPRSTSVHLCYDII